ncbi:MAG: hypothetical protein ACOC44_00345 [Promethearchaeia archaeon]
MGDLIESLIGGVFDVFLYTYFLRQGKALKKTTGVFLLESLDLTDFLTLGLIDFLGWIEIIPFWFLFFTLLDKRDEESFTSKKTSLSITDQKQDKDQSEKINLKYPYCRAEISPEQQICEGCGKELFKKRKLKT